MFAGISPGRVVAAGQVAVDRLYCWNAAANCRKSFARREACDRSCARLNAALARAARIPMITTTTMISTSVNAAADRERDFKATMQLPSRNSRTKPFLHAENA